jgi:S-adenosyl methyltransferase
VSSQDAAAPARGSAGPGRPDEPPSFDITRAHPARVYDYWLGGKDNYEADREAGDQVIEAMPSILPTVRANRAFLGRAVRHLVTEAGVRQFLDVGTGLPTNENTHQIAQGIAPASRIVYVDNDPIVLAHARALLDSSPEGATAYLDADIRDPEKILHDAARTLDFGQPVALITLLVLHFIPDADDPWGIVSRLVDAVPSGSYLVMSHGTLDFDPGGGPGTDRYNERVPTQMIPRPRAEIARFFDGLDLIEPGLVALADWRAEPGQMGHIAYAAVGRKR